MSLPPNVKENLTEKIIGERLVLDDSKHVTKYVDVVPGDQRAHGLRVCCRNTLDQFFVRIGCREPAEPASAE
jgi:hypothetical protein